MLKYEDLILIEPKKVIYYVGIGQTEYEEQNNEVSVWELSFIGKNEERCMLERPTMNTHRFDVYQGRENQYPMFSTKQGAEAYLKSLKNEIHDELTSMTTEDLLEELFRVYEGCLNTYEVPYTEFTKDQLTTAKSILKERLGLGE